MATTNPNPVPVRRGSLVGPLIILVLGIIFLANNLRPDLSLWTLFGRYWPFLLIFWGVARLVEYTLARTAGRPIARTISGGEVFLAILICLLGSSIFTAERRDWHLWRLGHRGVEVFGDNYDFTLEGTHAAPPNATVVVVNLQGNVRVVGVDGAQMRVTGRKSIKAFDRPGAEQADKQTPLEITEQGGQLYIRTNQDRISGDRRISTDLEISLPKTASLRLENRYGDFDVRDVAGPVDVSSGNAGVRLSNITKDIRVNVKRSDIVRAAVIKGNVLIAGRGRDIDLETIGGAVTIEGDFTGSIKLHDLAKPVHYASSATELSIEKVPGRVEMDLGNLHASDVVGPFKLNARSKDVRIEGFSRELDITSRRGDVAIRDPRMPLGGIHVESQNGSIELSVPPNAVFSLDAKTTHGKVENEFGETIQVEEFGKSAKRRGATASKSGAGVQIRLYTERGDITLKKASNTQTL